MSAAEMPAGYRLVTFESVGSTNTEAMRLAATGDLGHVWLTARQQTNGRGRSGRSWSAVSGNLYASLLLRLSCGPQTAQQLALLAGVAVVDGLRKVADSSLPAANSFKIGLRLKWPNDVLVGRCKVGGILLESAQELGAPGLVMVVGIGINVAAAPEELGLTATSLSASAIATDCDAVLGAIASAMDATLAIWDEGTEFEMIRAAWADRAGPVGEPLVVNAGQGPVSGYYAGLDRDGALLLADGQGGLCRYTYGDVTLAGLAGA